MANFGGKALKHDESGKDDRCDQQAGDDCNRSNSNVGGGKPN